MPRGGSSASTRTTNSYTSFSSSPWSSSASQSSTATTPSSTPFKPIPRQYAPQTRQYTSHSPTPPLPSSIRNSPVASVRNSPVPSHRSATPEPSLTELIHAAGRSQARHAGRPDGQNEPLYRSKQANVALQHPQGQRRIEVAVQNIEEGAQRYRANAASSSQTRPQLPGHRRPTPEPPLLRSLTPWEIGLTRPEGIPSDNKPVMPPAHVAFRAVFHYNSDRDNFRLDTSPAGWQYLRFDRNLCPFLRQEDMSRSIAFLRKQAGLEFWFRRGSWSIRTGQVSPQDYGKIEKAVRDAHTSRKDLRMTFTVKCELVTRRNGSLFKRQQSTPLHYKVTSAYVEDRSVGTAHVI